MTLGEKIQKLRQEHNFTQKELAEKLNTSTADVAVWESGETFPSVADIAKLSSVLGVTTDTLIVDSEIPADEVQHNSGLVKVVEREVQHTGIPSDKKTKVSKKKLAFLISLSVIFVAVFGVLTYKFLLPFSKNTAAIEKAACSVVKIYCYDYDGNESASGSGFVAFDDQTVVTNYHVMENAYKCRISTEEDKTYEAESILAYSKDQDIAIIKLKKPTGLRVLSLGNSDKIKKGETIIAIGSPLGIKNTVSQGVLSGRLMEDNMDVLQFTAPISSGSSGGALFDDNGKVIGITYASIIEGQNLNLAIPIELATTLYSNRTETNIISEIYLQSRPELRFSNEYPNAVTVTFEQLKQNPTFYNGKIIKITTYISSENPNFDYEYYVSNKDDVSGDYKRDRTVGLTAVVNKSHKYSGIIGISASPEYNRYHDKSITVGDGVTIIGEFKYDEQELTALERIYAAVIYKNNS